MKWWWSAKELTRVKGLPSSKRGVNKKALAESWPHRPRKGRGGGREYPLSCLPEETQLLIIKNASNEEIEALDVQRLKELCPSAQELFALRLGQLGKKGLPGLMHEEGQLVKRPKRLSRAAIKAELVRSYLDAVQKQVAQGIKKTEAKREFEKAYNTGTLLPSIYNEIGPRSWKTLERWAKRLEASNWDCQVLEKTKKKVKSAKVTSLESQVLLKLLLKQERLKIGTAIRYTKWLIESQGAKSPSSPATLRRFAEGFKKRNFHLWTLARHGEKALKDKVLPFLERDSSLLEVGECLVADGHKLNFKVINPFTGRPCRASLILWMDWASRDVCGYTIMPTEDIYAIHESLRRAILKLGKLPKSVLLDNGKAFRAKVFTSKDLREEGISGLYGSLGIVTYFARPYEARTKPVERFFGTLGTQFERLISSYTGASIEDKPARMRRNEKFMQELSPEVIPTIEEVSRRLDAWIAYYRSQPHSGLNGKTPQEVFEAGKGPGINEERLRFLMQFKEKKKVRRNGIRFLGHYYWDERLYGLRERVNIRYDLSDLTKVHVYDKNWEFICTCKRMEKVDPLYRLHEGKEAKTYPEFKERLKQQKRLLNETKKVVRLAAQNGHFDEIKDELPWMEAMEGDPGLPEKIERIASEASPDIPDMGEKDTEIVDIQKFKSDYMPRGSINPAVMTDAEVPSDEEFDQMVKELLEAKNRRYL